MLESSGPYRTDLQLLAKLGLPVWKAPLEDEEVCIGEVFPYPEHEETKGRTKLRIFVKCYPAQVYRFEIERPSQDDGYDGMETLQVETCSGSLSDAWPFALAVAGNMVSVSNPVRMVGQTLG